MTDDPRPMDSISTRDDQQVPDHVVDMLAAIASKPKTPHGPTADQWRGDLREIAERIWREAWAAGSAHGLDGMEASWEYSQRFDGAGTLIHQAPDRPRVVPYGNGFAMNSSAPPVMTAEESYQWIKRPVREPGPAFPTLCRCLLIRRGPVTLQTAPLDGTGCPLHDPVPPG